MTHKCRIRPKNYDWIMEYLQVLYCTFPCSRTNSLLFPVFISKDLLFGVPANPIISVPVFYDSARKWFINSFCKWAFLIIRLI